MRRCQKVQKFDFQSQFSTLKIIRIFLMFFHFFCYWPFLITSIFKSLYFLKWCPIFDTSLHQFSKFNNLLWVCWFIGKNISNFELPAWKFNNPYCHNFQVSVQKRLSIHFHISDSIHSLFSKWANCQIDSLLKNHYCWVPPYCFWAYLLVGNHLQNIQRHMA